MHGQLTPAVVQMDALATCVRRVARLLWSVHVSFVDGFDENMLYLLQQQYPSDLMPLLAEHSQGALQEAVDAFPARDCVISSNLTLFVTAVEVPLPLHCSLVWPYLVWDKTLADAESTLKAGSWCP